MSCSLKSPAIRLFNSLADPHQRNIKVRITGPLYGELTGEFPAQRDSNLEKASIWWRHHRRSNDRILLIQTTY